MEGLPPSGTCADHPLVRLQGIEKSFGPISALNGVTVDLYPGEVHALLGENGAGKSTLMNILAGNLQPDSGFIEINGAVATIRSRRDGARYGIGYVQQHFSLIDELTVAQNFMLGHPETPLVLRRQKVLTELQSLGERLQIPVIPSQLVGQLSIGERQRLEILIAVSWGAQVLLLDEPTAATGPAEFDLLAEVVGRLRAAGTAVVYVSHKIPEIESLGDRVTVLRNGEVVGRHSPPIPSREQLVAEMVGRIPEMPDVATGEVGDSMLVLKDVATARGRTHPLRTVNLTVRTHEIVGVAGVAGNGQDDLAAVLCGLLKPSSGFIPTRPSKVAFIPEDRKKDGLALDLPILDNAIVHAHRQADLNRRGWVRAGAVRRYTERVMAMFSISGAPPTAPANVLSGGNQQRVVLGRELIDDPQLIVAHNPTRGLDVAATLDVHRQLLEARAKGAAVVVISPDLDELFSLSNRVVVLYAGVIAGEVRSGPDQRTHVVRLMTAGASP